MLSHATMSHPDQRSLSRSQDADHAAGRDALPPPPSAEERCAGSTGTSVLLAPRNNLGVDDDTKEITRSRHARRRFF